MNSSGKRYSCSSQLQDENLSSNVDKNQAIIKKQNDQLAKLREYFITLRNRYHDERRDFAMKSISLQRAIDHEKRKGDQLEQRINEIRSSIENAENEKNANELIEQIWCILSSFRKDIFEEAEEDLPDNSFTVGGANMNNDRKPTRKNIDRNLSTAASTKEVRYGSSIKNTRTRSKSKCSSRKMHLESDSDSFDNDQSLPSPLDMESSNCGEFVTPSKITEIEMTPITPVQDDVQSITPSSTSCVNEIMATPVTPSNENFCDSIASRRTKRRCTTNVYYKEPSLRNALTPGDPFTFSLEDGIVTPTVPDNYSRDTPSVNTKRRGRKNH